MPKRQGLELRDELARVEDRICDEWHLCRWLPRDNVRARLSAVTLIVDLGLYESSQTTFTDKPINLLARVGR